MTEHTPGPWRNENAEIRSESKLIAQLAYWHMTYAEGYANARLIAAAPDLLAALEHWVEHHEVTAYDCPGSKRFLAAIAKAKGEPVPSPTPARTYGDLSLGELNDVAPMTDDCTRMHWTEFREQVRAIMRGGGDPYAVAAHDLIREVIEWHNAEDALHETGDYKEVQSEA